MGRPCVDYFRKMNGKRIDYDWWKWYQCVDLFKDYMDKVLGIKLKMSWNADDIWTNKYYIFKTGWRRIVGTRDLMQGDVIVRGTETGFHVAIFDHICWWQVYVWEQNGIGKNKATKNIAGDWIGWNAIRLHWYTPSFWSGVWRNKKIEDNFKQEIAFIDAKLTTKLTAIDRKNTIDYKNSIRYIVK